MDGQPVWLASVARRTIHGMIIPTDEWVTKRALFSIGEHALREILKGAGDGRRERLFRMNMTLCLHRALTDLEVRSLDEEWHSVCPVDIAGGPIEVLKSRGVVERPRIQPCENPKRIYPPGERHPKLWIPEDCGACEPCLDRARARESTPV